MLDNLFQHILETVTIGTRKISRSKATYSQVYKFLSEHVRLYYKNGSDKYIHFVVCTKFKVFTTELNVVHQNSVGVSRSGGFDGISASLKLDVNVLDQTVNENTNIGESLTEFTIGSEHVPLPIHVKVVPITEAVGDIFWDKSELPKVHQKRTHLEKALTDYADNKRAHVADGMLMPSTYIYVVCSACVCMCVCLYSSIVLS